jgi:thiamine biosynthesis lipoprotein
MCDVQRPGATLPSPDHVTAPALARWERWGAEVIVLTRDAAALPRARAEVERELDAFDLACSRFRVDSELARVNAAAGRPYPVSALFLEVLSAAIRAAHQSAGAVDPTVGEALMLAGYDRDFTLLHAVGDGAPAAGPEVRFTRAPGLHAIDVDHERHTVAVAVGVRLDLGATAKALAADRCARAAYAATASSVLVSLGGDLAVAGPAPSGGWRVRVTEDHRAAADAPGQTISIFDGGLATSSTTVRRWSSAGDPRHHIIDPASGRPATVVWRTVSVAAGSCLDANTAATAAIVLGERAVAWLADRGLPARLVAADGRTRAVGDWPSEAPV